MLAQYLTAVVKITHLVTLGNYTDQSTNEGSTF